MRNMRWQLLFYFFIASALTLAVAYLGDYYYRDFIDSNGLWKEFILLLLLVGPIVGLFAVRRLQFKVNMLQLAMIQLMNGNLSERIAPTDDDTFNQLYLHFNEMADSMEKRVKLLQKIGENNVMLDAEASREAVAEERRRLARDLHDSVSQQLFALHMTASSLPKMLERDSEKALQLVEQVITMSQHTQKQIRNLIAQLRPIELQGRALDDALERWFPDYCRRNGLQGSMDIRLRERMSEAIEYQLFLIIQEGMANIVKHASAEHVSLALYETGHQYVLNITDDGRGFERGDVSSSSYGLATMQERAQKLGGNAEIMSRLGEGTRIKLDIPKFEQE